ncbi:MAG: response regulator transcription factor, partial [Acidimicrobiales bacterium]
MSMRGEGPFTVVVVDDDPVMRRLIRAALKDEPLEIIETGDAEAALEVLEERRADALLLDVVLPGMSGFELLRALPPATRPPTMMLSVRGSEVDRVLGLDLGASDYVVKPFMPRELAARVRALLRRSHPLEGRIEHGRLVIDMDQRRVLLDGKQVRLTAREFEVLAYLAASPGRVVSRRELLEEVWHSSENRQDPATVTEHVRRLRRKLGDDAEETGWLETVRGAG